MRRGDLVQQCRVEGLGVAGGGHRSRVLLRILGGDAVHVHLAGGVGHCGSKSTLWYEDGSISFIYSTCPVTKSMRVVGVYTCGLSEDDVGIESAFTTTSALRFPCRNRNRTTSTMAAICARWEVS